MSLLGAVDAVEADTFGVVVVQDFDDGTRQVGGENYYSVKNDEQKYGKKLSTTKGLLKFPHVLG